MVQLSSMSSDPNNTTKSDRDMDRSSPRDTQGTVTVRYVPHKRRTKKAGEVTFAEIAEPPPSQPPRRTKGAQELRAPFRKTPIHVPNRPPRFPPGGAWPIEMRADMVAAYLDFTSTRELCKAIARGDAPKPDSTRGMGIDLEVVWSSKTIEQFVTRKRSSS